jgi:hypothetical protein
MPPMTMMPVMPVVVVMPMASVVVMPVPLDVLQKPLIRAYALRALLRRQSGGLAAHRCDRECEGATDCGDAHKFHV